MCMCVVLCASVALLVASVCSVAPFEVSDKRLLPFGFAWALTGIFFPDALVLM